MSFHEFPKEILEMQLKHLCLPDLVNFMSTNSKIAVLVRNNAFWYDKLEELLQLLKELNINPSKELSYFYKDKQIVDKQTRSLKYGTGGLIFDKRTKKYEKRRNLFFYLLSPYDYFIFIWTKFPHVWMETDNPYGANDAGLWVCDINYIPNNIKLNEDAIEKIHNAYVNDAGQLVFPKGVPLVLSGVILDRKSIIIDVNNIRIAPVKWYGFKETWKLRPIWNYRFIPARLKVTYQAKKEYPALYHDFTGETLLFENFGIQRIDHALVEASDRIYNIIRNISRNGFIEPLETDKELWIYDWGLTIYRVRSRYDAAEDQTILTREYEKTEFTFHHGGSSAKICSQCGIKPATALCGGCMSVAYCDEKCHADAWTSHHKFFCPTK